MENYSKYNNLCFKTQDGKTGYIKANGEEIILFSSESTLSRTTGERIPKVIIEGYLPDNVQLIPRDPEIFNDFRVGDVLERVVSDMKVFKYATVVGRFRSTIVLEQGGNYLTTTDIHHAFIEGWRLNLSAFELKLLKQEKVIKY